MSTGYSLRRIDGCTPTFLYSNGYNIPVIGLGTSNLQNQTVEIVKNALEVGYRHFDCAHVYRNEIDVGDALATAMNDKIVEREDIFVTSKLWNTFHGSDSVRKACKISLNNLRLEYLDNYLMHWPMAYKDGEDLHPCNDIGKIAYSTLDYVETWKAMEKLVEEGLCRNIGLCNFNTFQIERILQAASIRPKNLQIESHPYLTQQKLVDFCKKRKIVITAYGSFGSPNLLKEKYAEFSLLKNRLISTIAKKHGKTPAQVLLRYQLQRGNAVIPKANNKAQLIENISVFDFQLNVEEMTAINSLDGDVRFNEINEYVDSSGSKLKGMNFIPLQKRLVKGLSV